MPLLTANITSTEIFGHFFAGNEDAFNTVYRQHYYKVYQYARQWLPEPQDAEDITADVFIKLWNRRESFESPDAIAPFLFVSVRNACYDFLRHKQVVAGKEKELLLRLTESGQTDFAIQETLEEFLKLIYAETEKMPEKMKEIFLLSYRDGLKPAEIARLLNLSVQTVSNQKTNAINLLKLAFTRKPLLITFLLFLENNNTWQA